MPDALGIQNFGRGEPEEENPEDDLMAMFRDEDAADEVEAPPADLTPLPREDGDEEAPPAEEPAAEEPETATDEEKARLWANKYTSPEDMERAYLEVTTGFTRVAQENAQIRQQFEQVQTDAQAQQAQMNEIVGFLQAQMAEQDPDFAAELEQRNRTQQMVDQQVAQRVAPLEQQMQQNDPQAAQAVARMRGAADDFYRRHSEIVQGSTEDIAMTQGVVQMMNAGVPIDLGNPDHLDLALEAAANPALAAELMMAPQALQVPGGVDVLRGRVGATIQASEASPTEKGTRAKAPVRQKVEGFVETGSGGAPQSGAPGKKPDEFDEAWDWYQGRSARGPLFGAKVG